METQIEYLATTDRRLSKLEGVFEQMNKRLGTLEGRFESLSQKIDSNFRWYIAVIVPTIAGVPVVKLILDFFKPGG